MNHQIRRLGPGDERVLEHLARRAADYDYEGEGEAREPLSPDDAASFLADPAVLHWVAFDGEQVLGHLHCTVVRKHAGHARELLLYEIAVHGSARRKGVGRALMAQMRGWMREQRVREVWVLADNPGAAAFYAACGFEAEGEQPTYMVSEG